MSTSLSEKEQQKIIAATISEARRFFNAVREIWRLTILHNDDDGALFDAAREEAWTELRDCAELLSRCGSNLVNANRRTAGPLGRAIDEYVQMGTAESNMRLFNRTKDAKNVKAELAKEERVLHQRGQMVIKLLNGFAKRFNETH